MIYCPLLLLLLISAALPGGNGAPPLFFPPGASGIPAVNSYSPEYGTFIGRLQSPPPPLSSSGSGSQQQQQLTATTGIAGGGQISGLVYAVNESTIQIVNFTFDGLMPDTFFWLDRSGRPTRDGIRLSTFEYGISSLGPYPPAKGPPSVDFSSSSSSSAVPQRQNNNKVLLSSTTADFNTSPGNNGLFPPSSSSSSNNNINNRLLLNGVGGGGGNGGLIRASVRGASTKRGNVVVGGSPQSIGGNPQIVSDLTGGSSDSSAFGSSGGNGTSRVVLVLPDDVKLASFRSLALFSLVDGAEGQNLATVQIPENLVIPRTQLLHDELRGQRYGLSSGVIQLLDARTVKIFGFMFQGDKAPDGYFYVGRGLNVSREAGVKAVIRGRDSPELITPINERYTGGQDIFVELPEGFTIHSIDWISVYCLRFEIDFGHVFLRNVSRTVPPFVPAQKSFADKLDEVAPGRQWNVTNLVGHTKSQLNFTFQLGPPGGILGYRSTMRVARPPRYVWYVNGYLAADLYLKRGVNYTFIVEGGRNASDSPALYNPLYLSNGSYGGYSKLSNSERQHVRKYLPREAAGRLCRWEEEDGTPPPDEFTSFVDYRDWLRLECESASTTTAASGGSATTTAITLNEGDPSSLLWFVPDKETPDVIYYGSYTNYQMGGRIFVLDEFPQDLTRYVAEAFRYDANAHKAKLQQELERNSAESVHRFSSLSLAVVLCGALVTIFLSSFPSSSSPIVLAKSQSCCR